MMGAGRTFFCVFCLGLATLLLLQKRQHETVRKLGNTHQRDKSYKQQKTRDFLTEKRYLSVNKTEIFVQPELSELAERYKARRELVARVCQEQAEDLEARLVFYLCKEGGTIFLRYKARWPDKSWDLALAKADVLEKRDRGMLWCKVPKAASESWTGLFIKQWYSRKAKQLMWRQQVTSRPLSSCEPGSVSRCCCTRCGRLTGGRPRISGRSHTLTSPS